MTDTLNHHWIHDFFGGKRDFYGNVYKEMGVFDRKNTEKEVDGVLNLLKPEPGSHILDWCGGWGRHAVPLAKRGFKVTLLDFSEDYLKKAGEYARNEGVKITTVHSDFRETPPSIQADYAVNLFTAGLGYLGEANDVVALKSLFVALKPNAKILIDTMSLFWIVKNFKDRNWDESADGKKRYLQRRVFDFLTNTVNEEKVYQDIEAKTEEEAVIQLKVYSPADLFRILKVAEFVPQELCGDFDGSKFGFDSKRLVIVAGKEK